MPLPFASSLLELVRFMVRSHPGAMPFETTNRSAMAAMISRVRWADRLAARRRCAAGLRQRRLRGELGGTSASVGGVTFAAYCGQIRRCRFHLCDGLGELFSGFRRSSSSGAILISTLARASRSVSPSRRIFSRSASAASSALRRRPHGP